MSDQIGQVQAIRDSSPDRSTRAPYSTSPHHARSGAIPGRPSNVTRRDEAASNDGLSIGAPADKVELSLDPGAVRELPSTLYLKFLVDEKSGDVVVQVLDSETNEVVRQVPSRQLRDALRSIP